MPYVHLSTPTGAIDMHYYVATPSSHSSPSISPHLPCVLFLHAGYAASEVFESQFSDSRLRSRCNLLAVDMRAYGSTKGLVGKQNYSPVDSADDVYRFIKALGLPPLHVFGLSIGCNVGLELATAHPEVVVSLTLCSPLSSTEPEDIAAGRQEVYNYWVHAFNHDGKGRSGNGPSHPLETDDAILSDCILGAQQLCFNNESNTLTAAMTRLALGQAAKNRAGTPTKISQSYQVSVGWFLNRRPLSLSALAKLRQCSIRIIQFEGDIAYPIHYAQELESAMRRAGIADVKLFQLEGPHYGNVLNPQGTNSILLDAVSSALSKQGSWSGHGHGVSPVPHLTELEGQYCPSSHNGRGQAYTAASHGYQKMQTPWTKALSKYGYDPHEDDEDSE